MGSVYGTLETQMLEFMGNPTDSVSIKNMLMTSFNWFQNILSLRGDWDELEVPVTKTLVLGQSQYGILTDFGLTNLRKISSIKLNDGTRFFPPMPYVTPLKYDANFAPTVHYGNAKPSAFTRRGNYILFDKPAEAGLTIEMWYYKYPDPVTSNVSTVEFSSFLDPALCAMAIGMTWLGLEEGETAKKWLNVGTGMFKEVGIDVKTIVDLRSFSSIKLSTGDYISDPFTKAAP